MVPTSPLNETHAARLAASFSGPHTRDFIARNAFAITSKPSSMSRIQPPQVRIQLTVQVHTWSQARWPRCFHHPGCHSTLFFNHVHVSCMVPVFQYVYTILPRCCTLFAVMSPPPPIFGRTSCKGLLYLHYTPPPPPPPRGPPEPVCDLQFMHVYGCCKCVEEASIRKSSEGV